MEEQEAYQSICLVLVGSAVIISIIEKKVRKESHLCKRRPFIHGFF
jgi:hypothetical protein